MTGCWSYLLRGVLTLFFVVATPYPACSAEMAAGTRWEALEPGLDLGRFLVEAAPGRPGEVLVLRINRAEFSFAVLSAATPNERVRPLRDWAADHQLVAAINAGMYQPDGRTHTGYLRVGEYMNNPHIASRLGAFFVASPDVDELPSAAVLDRAACDWAALLPQYDMVVQNFRMISADRRLQWVADGPEHAISAVGEDGEGNILFIHCSEAMTCAAFARRLLELPIDVRQVMYVEGGSQAGLFVDSGREAHVWAGRHPAGYWPVGGINAPLPNVIGVKRKP